MVEHLAAEEPDIFLRSWWRPKQSKKIEQIVNSLFVRWQGTQLRINADVAPHLLDE